MFCIVGFWSCSKANFFSCSQKLRKKNKQTCTLAELYTHVCNCVLFRTPRFHTVLQQCIITLLLLVQSDTIFSHSISPSLVVESAESSKCRPLLHSYGHNMVLPGSDFPLKAQIGTFLWLLTSEQNLGTPTS